MTAPKSPPIPAALQKDVFAILNTTVRSVLSSEAAKPYVAALQAAGYDPATLPALAGSLLTMARRLLGASTELRDLMERLDTHFDLNLFPRYRFGRWRRRQLVQAVGLGAIAAWRSLEGGGVTRNIAGRGRVRQGTAIA